MTEQTTYTEAPASVTIKSYSPDGFDVLLTIRDADTSALMPRLAGALDWLKAKGFKPTAGGAAASSGGNGSAPVCQYHGAMKRSKKFNGWYCPAKMGDGGYCKEKVMD